MRRGCQPLVGAWGGHRGADCGNRTGDWQFQWFLPDQSINVAENTTRCQGCHQNPADNEHMFTFGDILNPR